MIAGQAPLRCLSLDSFRPRDSPNGQSNNTMCEGSANSTVYDQYSPTRSCAATFGFPFARDHGMPRGSIGTLLTLGPSDTRLSCFICRWQPHTWSRIRGRGLARGSTYHQPWTGSPCSLIAFAKLLSRGQEQAQSRWRRFGWSKVDQEQKPITAQ